MAYLMYHEIEVPGRPVCHQEPGYQRYVVGKEDFEAQMGLLKSEGWRGQCVGDALTNPVFPGVVITFDDGCETDLLIATPLLRELGYRATFYITVGFLGRPGYLTRSQLTELADLGCEIGSHSMTHAYLPDLALEQLAVEIGDSRKQLAEITGQSIDHFSCPGGRWNPRVMAAAKQAGYRSFATSQTVTNLTPTDDFALGRIAIMRGIELQTFRRLIRGEGLWKIRLGETVRSALKRVLGNSTYDRLREQLLDPRTR